jgi:hypothetical protein
MEVKNSPELPRLTVLGRIIKKKNQIKIEYSSMYFFISTSTTMIILGILNSILNIKTLHK